MRFFTSDTHYFHASLLGHNDFAPRPFPSLAVMHETMICNWNAVVKPSDSVYHLGDVALHPEHEEGFAEILALLTRLNGQIVFVKGNHDTRAFFRYLKAHDPGLADGGAKFAFHDVGVLLKLNHYRYYLTHYPLLLGQTLNIRNLHGHIHHYSVPLADNINVGVDAPELAFLTPDLPFGTPISENQLEIIIAKKQAELTKTR